MAEQSFGPVVVRRRLGAELRRLRERAGLNLDQVAREMEVSPSKLSRVEGGHSPAKLWDVRNLLTLYGVEDEDYRGRVERWVGESRAQGWWHPYSDASPTDLDHYISLESEAAEVRAYCSLVLQGLVQTEEYARALLVAVLPDLDPEEIEGLVRIRLGRQQVMFRDVQRATISIVVDEPVLLRRVGDDSVTLEQWRHLTRLPAEVDLRVRRLDAPLHLAMLGPFTVFRPRLADVDPVVVNAESAYYDAYWEEPDEVARFNAAFEALQQTALSRAESVDFIQRLIDEATSTAER